MTGGPDAAAARTGRLRILRGAETFLVVAADGSVTGLCGHVDLGTGIRTALAQIIAEELDIALARVTLVLGDTDRVPDQGPTIASETIQVAAVPLRQAAAQARHHLVGEAAARLGLPPEAVLVEDGIIRRRDGGNASLAYGEIIAGERVDLALRTDLPLKAPADYRLVGRPVPRVDIPAKATGRFTYVHDVRVPGMLHGRVVRPPYAGIDAGPMVGSSLIAVERGSIAHLPGIVDVVVIGDFIGIVAEREEQAIQAAEKLVTRWKPWAGLPDLNVPEAALRAQPATPRVLLDRGNVDAALAGAAPRMRRRYVWPYQMHGSIGPACSLADYRDGTLTLWSGTQNPLPLRRDLAQLLAMAETKITILRFEAAGCYGRNCADDVGADAALLSRAVGRPVRVQLTREQEHAWEPKGAAQVMDVDGGLDASGAPAAYDFATRYPSNAAPTLALLLTGTIPPEPAVLKMGDRTAVPPYNYAHARVTVHDMAPIARASWLRGVSALPNSFAHESYIDELATAAGVDPIAYRLRYLDDPRARDLIAAVADRAGWVPHQAPQTLGRDGERLLGRGFAYAVYRHGPFPGTAAAWSAWVADVAVDPLTGVVDVTRVVVGQDAGLMINPAGVEHQLHGNVIQSTSRVLKEQVRFDAGVVASREWAAYPILSFPEVPRIETVLMLRPDEPPLGAGESASVPSAAAIANAIFDATGVRFREPPFTPERVRAALRPDEPAAPPALASPRQPKAPAPQQPGTGMPAGWRRWFGGAFAIGLAAAAGLGAIALPWSRVIAPIPRPDPGVFAAATIARGGILAHLGACAVCHDGPDGRSLAGGRAIETPFGRVYASNITPDAEAGIGAWSYPAFERAMREGLSRNGRHLYPAHPYTSFTRTSDADLEALYAFLMAQPAAPHLPKVTRLAFPFNLRRLMAGWNALFLRPGALRPDPTRSDLWNRGAYLVEGLGHCSACHSPRNLLGAEGSGAAHLAGGLADGWQAPALTAASLAPVPWTEEEFFAYLSGQSTRRHGAAAGPMADVVAELAQVPEADRRAMAHYLASFQAPAPAEAALDALAHERLTRAATAVTALFDPGARLYAGACALCHEATGALSLSGGRALALNSNLQSDRPDNLIQVILQGIARPSAAETNAMPGFAQSFSDAQIAELLAYLRSRFAPDRAAWTGLAEAVARIRGR